MEVPHIILEATLRVPVAVPYDLVVETMGKTPDELSHLQLRSLVAEDPDRLQDAIDAYLEQQPEFDVDYNEDVDQALPEPFKTIRPDGFYTDPAPSMLERYNLTKGELSVNSPANVLSDEQARGALWAARQTWNLPAMNRRQREYLILLVSELEWICCARPALHFFKASDEDATICSYCGQGEPGHDVRKEPRVEEAQEQPHA